MVNVKFFFSHRSSVWLLFKNEDAPEPADLTDDAIAAVTYPQEPGLGGLAMWCFRSI